MATTRGATLPFAEASKWMRDRAEAPLAKRTTGGNQRGNQHP